MKVTQATARAQFERQQAARRKQLAEHVEHEWSYGEVGPYGDQHCRCSICYEEQDWGIPSKPGMPARLIRRIPGDDSPAVRAGADE